MNKKLLFFTAAVALLSLSGKAQTLNEAVFDSFIYKGENRFANQVNDKQYQNPILAGFCPDPAICRKGNDYYIINSTFAYFPGVPIWHSTDLVNWTQIGHVLNRESQLKLGKSKMSGGIYAPDIKYNPHDNKFYMITTGTGYGSTTIVTTDNPKKQNWSDPIALNDVHGIDPGLFFDDDGKAYIVNNDAPAYPAEYDGHRAIWIREFDYKNGKTVGEAKVIIDKGINKNEKPIWIEGPHLYKINGTYYLMAAEGGTGEWHSEVILTADNPFGPYTPCKINPILTQRDLPRNRMTPITSAGHADLIQTEAGDWYAVFLACLPYKGDLYNTGRETFMLPVTWKNNQPIILTQGKEIPYFVDKSKEMMKLEKKNKQKGFDFYNPGPLWNSKRLTDKALFIRNPKGDFYSIDKQGKLHLKTKEVNLSEFGNPAYIGQRQTSWRFTATAEMTFTPQSPEELAGIICFQNDTHYIQFGKTLNAITGKPELLLEVRQKGETSHITTFTLPNQQIDNKLLLCVEGTKPDLYTFSYSADGGENWTVIGEPIDTKFLSTKMATGFQGVTMGVYATQKLERGNMK